MFPSLTVQCIRMMEFLTDDAGVDMVILDIVVSRHANTIFCSLQRVHRRYNGYRGLLLQKRNCTIREGIGDMIMIVG